MSGNRDEPSGIIKTFGSLELENEIDRRRIAEGDRGHLHTRRRDADAQGEISFHHRFDMLGAPDETPLEDRHRLSSLQRCLEPICGEIARQHEGRSPVAPVGDVIVPVDEPVDV